MDTKARGPPSGDGRRTEHRFQPGIQGAARLLPLEVHGHEGAGAVPHCGNLVEAPGAPADLFVAPKNSLEFMLRHGLTFSCVCVRASQGGRLMAPFTCPSFTSGILSPW